MHLYFIRGKKTEIIVLEEHICLLIYVCVSVCN